jgi:hypothetical protein
MTRQHTLALILSLAALFTTACEQTSIASQEEIRNFETLQALTPTITPSPTATATATATATPTATTGPSPTPVPPTATLIPSATALPPTATPDPALRGFSACTQTAGDPDGGRFSTRVLTVTASIEPAFERLTLALDVPGDSAAPHATARCLPAAAGYELSVDLEGWLRDDAFRSSVATATQTLSGTTLLKQLQYRVAPDAISGASIVLPLSQPHPFRIALETNPYRLVIEVAKNPAVGPSSDMLALPAPGGDDPDGPIFFLRDGDIWAYRDGNADNLTDTPEVETAISASQAGGRLAFCRATSAPGDVAEVSSLWVMELDGTNQQELAAPGRSCAEPSFSTDGTKIAFTVDEDATGAQPARLSIWTIDLTSGVGPERATAADDQWSRFGPQWLDDERMVYVAQAEDGRSTLFLRNEQRQELEIGAPLLVAEGTQGQSVARYRGFGRPLVAPDGKTIAVEALRLDKPGADLLLLDSNGNEQKGGPGDGFWSRPVAFAEDGTLYYLTSACASDAIQSYALIAHPRSGADKTIALGATAGGFGQFIAVDDGLAYVTLDAPGATGQRGPLVLEGSGASALWFWDIAGGSRAQLAESQEPIRGLAR